MKFKEADFKQLAKSVGGNQKFVRRVLGSVKVGIVATLDADEDDFERKELELGFRLIQGEKNVQLTKICDVLMQYYKSCPQVCQWLGRGDFDPGKIPENVSRGNLLHACRTVGRLRASAFRQAF